MHLGEFQREVEYLDPGLPVERELIEPAVQLVPDQVDDMMDAVKV